MNHGFFTLNELNDKYVFFPKILYQNLIPQYMYKVNFINNDVFLEENVDNQLRRNPFRRKWMEESGAAAAGGGGKGLRGILAGALTGGIEICITYPTEYVKTQLQLDQKGAVKQYTGIADVIVKTIKNHGFFGLYRGLSVLIYGSVPKAAVRFGSFEQLKSWSVDENGRLGPAGRAWCGMGAGIMEAIIAVTPMETIKVKLINDRRLPEPRYKGFAHAVKIILSEEGFRGVYQGLLPTVLKQGTNQAMRFSIMETLKEWHRGGDPTAKVQPWATAIYGATAGAISVFGNTPIDVIKTRMQSIDAKKYKGTWDCIKQTFIEDGIRGFYKGTVPRLFRVVLDVAITFTLYDAIMEIFDNVWPEK